MEAPSLLKGFLLTVFGSILAGLVVYSIQDDFRELIRGKRNVEARPLSPVGPPEGTLPPARMVDCRLRSATSQQQTIATFKNGTSRRIAVYWLDFDGIEKYFFKLDPGQQKQMKTFFSHPWCIRSVETGEALAATTIVEENQWIILN